MKYWFAITCLIAFNAFCAGSCLASSVHRTDPVDAACCFVFGFGCNTLAMAVNLYWAWQVVRNETRVSEFAQDAMREHDEEYGVIEDDEQS